MKLPDIPDTPLKQRLLVVAGAVIGIGAGCGAVAGLAIAGHDGGGWGALTGVLITSVTALAFWAALSCQDRETAGQGMTAPVNALLTQHRSVPGARVFLFDKGASFGARPALLGQGASTFVFDTGAGYNEFVLGSSGNGKSMLNRLTAAEAALWASWMDEHPGENGMSWPGWKAVAEREIQERTATAK